MPKIVKNWVVQRTSDGQYLKDYDLTTWTFHFDADVNQAETFTESAAKATALAIGGGLIGTPKPPKP